MKTLIYTVLILVQLNALYGQNKYDEVNNLIKSKDYISALEKLKPLNQSQETCYLLIQCYLNLVSQNDLSFNTRNEYYTELAKNIESYKKTGGNIKSDELIKELIVEKSIILQNQGAEFVKNSKFKSSLLAFEVAHYCEKQLETNDTLILYNLINVSNILKNSDKVLEYSNLYFDGRGNRKDIFFILINVLKLNQDVSKLIGILQKANRAYPDENAFVIEEINIYVDNKNYQEAISRINKELGKGKYNEDLMLLKADLLEAEGNFNEAETTYIDILKENSENIMALFKIGALYLENAVMYKDIKSMAGEYIDKAKVNLEKAYSLDPNNIDVLKSLSQLYSLNGEFEKYNEIKKILDQKE